jgi:predicted aspartyl protease
MRFACFFLILTTALTAQTRVLLKAVRVGHFLVLKDVFLNGVGPFRMAIDTGNASSLIRPEVARRLRARAVHAVEQVTIAGVRRVPVVLLDRVTTGALTERTVEAMVGDVRLDALDGVLGQSWLVRHDYLLDYRSNWVVVDGVPPDRGLSTALHSEDGRPLLSAKVDGASVELLLDSGASMVVLFECTGQVRRKTTLLTNGDCVEAGETSTKIALPGDKERNMHAVCVRSPQHARGLLPASVFSAVFVSNRYGFLRLTR